MTPEDLMGELEKRPFRPLRLHLVSGNSLDVWDEDQAFMLQNAVMILQPNASGGDDAGYDIVSLWNIERIEQLRIALDESEERD